MITLASLPGRGCVMVGMLLIGSCSSATTHAASPTTTMPTTTSMPTTMTTTIAPKSRLTVAALLKQKAVVLAHAGGDVDSPHSTMYAFKSAARLGVDVLDLDVQLTKDGVLIVQHDDTVDKTTNATGPVASLTFDEIKKLDNAYWWSPKCWPCQGLAPADYPLRGIRTGQTPPPAGFTPDDFRVISFEELVQQFPESAFNIEIKGKAPAANPAGAELARLLTKYAKQDQAVIASFDDAEITEFHRIAPDIAVSPAISVLTAWVLQGTPLPAEFKVVEIPPIFAKVTVLTTELVVKAHAAGVAVWVWPDDNKLENVDYYRSLMAYGIDGVIASKPAAMMQVAKELRGA